MWSASWAATPISSAALDRAGDRTTLVIESPAQLRFTLRILRFPNRVVLELEDVQPGPALDALAGQLAADHPYLRPPRITTSEPGLVRLEFALKGEAEPSVRSVKPQAGRGHRLVLAIVPPGVELGAVPRPAATAPQPSATVEPARPPAQLPGPASAVAVQPAPAPAAEPSAPAPPPSSTLAAVAQTGTTRPRADEPDLVLLELQLDHHLLAEALTGYQHGRDTFLPLGELARLLSLAIKVQPERGTAAGFVLTENRGFSLDVAQNRLTLADQTLVFDPAQVRVRSDDIYVERQLLSRWLPLDLQVDLSSLALSVRAREPLPLQARLERERAGAKLNERRTGQAPVYPRQDTPYLLLGVPFIDQTLGLGLTRDRRGHQTTSASYTAYLTGDLLGMESSLFVSSSQMKPSPVMRFTLGRHDPDAGLLGPLGARSVMFGSGVSMPSVANIASRVPTGNGYGLMLSNRPLTQPASFDRHTLQGDLPPGWDVELYVNDALTGFQTSRPDGRYSFDDIPLSYGANEFRLVFRGPLGQQRVERQSFLLEQSGVPPGAFHYHLAHLRNDAHSRSLGQFEWGLSRNLTAVGELVRLPAPAGAAGSGLQLYTHAGLRGFWSSFIVSNDLYRSPDGGWLNETGLKTRVGGVSLSYSHAVVRGFRSELVPASSDSLRARDRLRLDANIPAGFLRSLPATVELQREQFESGRTGVLASGRVSAYLGGTAISTQASWQSPPAGGDIATGSLNVSRRFGDMGLSGQLGYSLLPEAKLETVALAADKRLGAGYRLSLGLARSISSRETSMNASLNKNLGSFGLGLTMSYSSRGTFAAGLQLFVAMTREPREGRWRFDAVPAADSGAASVRVFLDNNANGEWDSGEEPIANVAFDVNGNRAPATTNAEGVAWLHRLPARQAVDIALNTQTLEDPYWVPQRTGVRLVPRPGRVAELDFPIVLTSEIDGTVYLFDRNSKRGIGDVEIELLDMQRKPLASTRSSSDGYYIVPAVVQGRYYLRVSPQQLRAFGLMDPGMREITVLPDGKFVNGVDFILIKEEPADGRASR